MVLWNGANSCKVPRSSRKAMLCPQPSCPSHHLLFPSPHQSPSHTCCALCVPPTGDSSGKHTELTPNRTPRGCHRARVTTLLHLWKCLRVPVSVHTNASLSSPLGSSGGRQWDSKCSCSLDNTIISKLGAGLVWLSSWLGTGPFSSLCRVMQVGPWHVKNPQDGGF